MTDALDPHSAFLTGQDMKKSEARTEGWYTGVGVELTKDKQGARISRVIPDSPADQAGIESGAILTHIDTEPMHGQSLTEISARLKGEEGSLVQISFIDRQSQKQETSLRRVRVRDKAIKILPGKPGFPTVRIDHFQRSTAADLEAGLNLLARRKSRIRGLVIDLRGNPGGLLDEAIAVVDLFLKEGMIFESRGRDNKTVARADAKPGSRWERTPLVILINGKSASASEIVAGALQAHGRAKLVGTPTYGKGSVQRMYIFEDHSALKLTVSRYYLANGTVVADREGLKPDVVVEAPTEHSVATERLHVLVDSLPEAERLEAKDLIETLGEDNNSPATQKSDPQLEAAWKIVHETP